MLGLFSAVRQECRDCLPERRAYDFTIGSELSFEVPDQTLDLYVLDGKKRHSGGFTADRDELAPASMCF